MQADEHTDKRTNIGRMDGGTKSLISFQSMRALLRRSNVAGNNKTY